MEQCLYSLYTVERLVSIPERVSAVLEHVSHCILLMVCLVSIPERVSAVLEPLGGACVASYGWFQSLRGFQPFWSNVGIFPKFYRWIVSIPERVSAVLEPRVRPVGRRSQPRFNP